MVENKNHFPQVNKDGELILHHPPIVSSYNDKLRPVINAVNNLRHLNVTKGISLPTIVVVGEQSAGKSSVLDSLSGVNLPRRPGTCTRVPVIIRLQPLAGSEPQFLLQFQRKEVRISNESRISDAIEQAMVEIAGDGLKVSNVPLTLVVKKRGFPDLTMVDLPGIIRFPICDQPKDIYQQIVGIIMEHITSEESIILNVFQAYANFRTCEFVSMSREVDTTGRRMLGVVTRCDEFQEGLCNKVIANEVEIRLGYVCVRNRVNNETYDEARLKEAVLFETHPELSKIDKSGVGIPNLARRIVEIQSMMILKGLSDIVEKINERLDSSASELNKLPQTVTTVRDAMAALMEMVGSLKETLRKILVRGEYDEYKDDKQMHFDARLVEMLNKFSKELHLSVEFCDDFLVEEIGVVQEAKGIRLPFFLPHSAFLFLLKKRLNKISELPVNFINKVWVYLETVCIRVFVDHFRNYPQLLPSMKKAACDVMAKMKNKFKESVVEMIEMEKVTDYTCNPNFDSSLKKLMGSHDSFVNAIEGLRSNTRSSSVINVEGYGEIDIKHLVSVEKNVRDMAFDLKMRMTAYWEIVLNRILDWIVLQLRFVIIQIVNLEMQTEIVNAVMVNDGCVEKMMVEPSFVAQKREKLYENIGLLQESKEVIGQAIEFTQEQ